MALKRSANNHTNKLQRKLYEKELRKLQVELCHLQDWVKDKGARIIILFEGRDAAGKGGTIKAITERVSPRVLQWKSASGSYTDHLAGERRSPARRILTRQQRDLRQPPERYAGSARTRMVTLDAHLTSCVTPQCNWSLLQRSGPGQRSPVLDLR
jgi:hypothetical protein